MQLFQCRKQNLLHSDFSLSTFWKQKQRNWRNCYCIRSGLLATQWAELEVVVFFPSFASAALARSSHSVCADERISQCMKQRPSLGSQKRSADHYAVQSPYRGRNEAKQNKSQTKKQQNRQNPATPIKGQLRRGRQLMCQWIKKILQSNKQTQPDTLARSCEGAKTSHSAAPKLRIPPARIPEIALRSPTGMRHLRNQRQPCIELGSNTTVGTLPCEAPRKT